MSGLVQDLRYTFRTLAGKPGFTAIILVTLALGIGANTAIFSVVNAVLLRPLPYPDPDQLTMIWQNNPSSGLGRSTVSPPNFIDWREDSKSFEDMAVFAQEAFNLSGRSSVSFAMPSSISTRMFSNSISLTVLLKQEALGRTDHTRLAFLVLHEDVATDEVLSFPYLLLRDRSPYGDPVSRADGRDELDPL